MKRFLTLTAVIGMLVLVPAALADNSSVLNGYGSSGSKPVVVVKGESTSSKPKPKQEKPATTGTLPFTGSDLAVLVGAGGLLLALGLGLRRVGRDKA